MTEERDSFSWQSVSILVPLKRLCRGQPGEAVWEGATEETSLGTGERAREASPLSPVTRCSLPPYIGHSRLDSEGGTHRSGEAGVS